MILGYTEFSFGYAITENLVRSSAICPTGAPVFPNLVQEARLGYDVRIDLPGVPMFFQFKLPSKMVKNNAREVAQLGLAGINTPFFRMPLMRRDKSPQHQHLIDWERRFPNCVYYASPTFQHMEDFNAAYVAGTVHIQTAYFSPLAIGPLPDDTQHNVSYAHDLSVAYRCSEPISIESRGFQKVAGTLETELSSRGTEELDESVDRVLSDVRELIPAKIRDAEDEIRGRLVQRRSSIADERILDERTREVSEKLLVARELARIGMGVELVMAQPRN
ncbi:hypothetical protein [Litoreibacter janthinus]|uniref:Uncharacterized protein n=1 Tax=Litoreibacter janthinus TaxID=670154 RepID=A0A1I6HSB8_9RHOB|nr:hypothetical protein [Litoreibacter janthinus]SFR57362.1 hypothetical protein SAMN04488002_3353 [Litoreibacter janthinus]